MKGKNRLNGFNQISKFCSSKDTIKKMKRQLTQWEKISASHVSNEYSYIEYIKNYYNSRVKRQRKNEQRQECWQEC